MMGNCEANYFHPGLASLSGFLIIVKVLSSLDFVFAFAGASLFLGCGCLPA